jgi:hypothetical protein
MDKTKLEITKELLAKELAEMPNWRNKRKKYDEIPIHTKIKYICEAERFIKAINRIRRRHEDRKKV